MINTEKASIDYVNTQNYSGSVEALGLKVAFQEGAHLSDSAADIVLVKAFIAGLEWGKTGYQNAPETTP